MSSRLEQLHALLEPTIVNMGCVCWGIEYHAQGNRSVLRVYIDRVGGVTIEDCEKISRQIGALMDVEDVIPSQYRLEVSSPGLDRPLFRGEQYRESIGSLIQVKLKMPFEGRRQFQGRVTQVLGEQEAQLEVCMLVEDHEYTFPIEGIDRAQVVPEFESFNSKGMSTKGSSAKSS